MLLIQENQITTIDTEKNTKKIFDEYYEFSKECDLTPILFFNEDSIFSKRVEVGHSSDRTHNSMQNILLEQMEIFIGISITLFFPLV